LRTLPLRGAHTIIAADPVPHDLRDALDRLNAISGRHQRDTSRVDERTAGAQPAVGR